ncbi:uncharacterized protein [Blastocystis hominis]|uniref:Uncharacterized protein n=1 Tax=Blastocystis hominis TaxID=12968 RepID=D8LY42_BLAHO|nr:uncharacterized protein [Blastocystis hominis]CBK20497.2 unnamed protein product [Blastocystis hominis]|eukprot:XP_012894545.1 uncharacterized protein [Blastocystis hominis]
MEFIDCPLICNRIGRISPKSEGSDNVILPPQLRPKRPNVFGFYIYKVTSETTDKWTYCCVRQWTAEEHDCYMPTVGD